MFAFHQQCFVDSKFARKMFIFNLCHLHSFSFDFSVEHMHFTALSLHKCFADAYFQLSLTLEKSWKEKDIFCYILQQLKVDVKYWLVPHLFQEYENFEKLLWKAVVCDDRLAKYKSGLFRDFQRSFRDLQGFPSTFKNLLWSLIKLVVDDLSSKISVSN